MRAGRLWSLILAWFFVVAQSHCERTKSVFVLHMENPHLPVNIAASNAIQEVIGRDRGVQVFEEYLDENRLDTDSPTMADALVRKYAGQPIDLILTIGPSALRFILQHREKLWPSVPIVFSAVDGKPRQLPPDVTGVYGLLRFAPTIDLALRLQPDIKHVFYVGGASPAEIARLTIAQNEFRPYAGRLDFTYLNDLPFPIMLDHISKMPEHSIVLFTTFFKDSKGEPFIAAKVSPLVAVASNGPVYGVFETYIGSGILGGSIYNFEAQVRQGAILGAKVLRGVPVTILPVEEGPSNETVLDWRQLGKWNISETRIPPGTTVKYREMGVWEHYRNYVLIFVAILLAQSSLIVLLVLQTQKSRKYGLATRLLTGRLIHAAEDERKRVASELHDDIGQRLSLVSIQLDSAIERFEPNGQNGHELKDCLREVDTLVTDVHDLSHELHSSMLEHLGLESELKELCRRVARRHELNVNLVAEGVSRDLQPDISLCFYRVAQEALSNSVRYSGTNRIELNLRNQQPLEHGCKRFRERISGWGVFYGVRINNNGGTPSDYLRNLFCVIELGRGTIVMASAPLHNGALHEEGNSFH